MQAFKTAVLSVIGILVLTLFFVALQDVPEVRRFTDRAVRSISLAALALFVGGLIFVIAHRLGASTERSQLTDTQTYNANPPPANLTPLPPQIFMLPPNQTGVPREVWERPLSQSAPATGAPAKVDWSVLS